METLMKASSAFGESFTECAARFHQSFPMNKEGNYDIR